MKLILADKLQPSLVFYKSNKSLVKIFSSLYIVIFQGEVCYFDCEGGFTRSLTSGTYTICMSSGVWSVTQFQCDVACPLPPNPQYGTFV